MQLGRHHIATVAEATEDDDAEHLAEFATELVRHAEDGTTCSRRPDCRLIRTVRRFDELLERQD